MRSTERHVILSALSLSLALVSAAAAADGRSPRTASRHDLFERLYRVEGTADDPSICFDAPVLFRIGVMEAQSRIRLTGAAPWRIAFGATTLDVPAGTVRGFRPAAAQAAKRRFWPVVETVQKADEAQLADVRRRWEALGHRVTVFPAGARLFFQDHQIHDNRRFFVSVEPTQDLTSCEAQFQQLQAQGAKPFAFETVDQAATGAVELLDGAGAVLGVFSEPARISSAEPLKVFDVEFAVGYPWHGFEDRSFRGSLEVRVDKVGLVQLVNWIDLESYLKGVVPSEMSSSYPAQALCAQAVAARGETMAKFGTRHLVDSYDLCSEQHCQVYSGLSRAHPNTDQAVEGTQGVILKHGELIADTVYSACCGGHSEHNDFVWSTAPSGCLRGRPDLQPESPPFPDPPTEAALAAWFQSPFKSWCAMAPDSPARLRWQKAFGQAELDALVAKKYPEVGSVRELQPVKRGVSGRLRELRIVGSRATVVIQKELPIRQLFGGLNSAAFVVKKASARRRATFTFVGAGWGHGVGMCQWGAKGQAQAGRTYQQILTSYFSDVDVQNFYSLK